MRNTKMENYVNDETRTTIVIIIIIIAKCDIKIYKAYLKCFKNCRIEFSRKARGNLHINICPKKIFEVQLNQVLTTILENFYMWRHLNPHVNSAPIENKEKLQHIFYACPTICHLASPPSGSI
jgi:hypothetical protein